MKSLREAFEEEYAAVSVPADNKNGFALKYIYYAPWYIWDLPEKELHLKKQMFVRMSVSSFLLYLIAGLQNAAVNQLAIPVIFGAAALCAHVMELFRVFQFRFAKYKTSRTTYQNINRTLRWAPLLRGGCMLITALAGIYCMAVHTVTLEAVTAVLGYLVCSAAAFHIFKEYRKLSFRTEKNTTIPENTELL